MKGLFDNLESRSDSQSFEPLTSTLRFFSCIKKNSLKELKAIPVKAYKKCIEHWINCWHACVGSKGAYFEGDNKDLY